jgi:hypothetical protein
LLQVGGRTSPDRSERMAVHRSPSDIIGEKGDGCHDAHRTRTRVGFLQKLFSPIGYIGAVILAILGLGPVNATQWLASHISPEAASWLSSDKGRWTFVAAGLLISLGMYRNHLGRLEKQAEEARKQRLPALSLPMMSIVDIATYLRDRSAWGWKRQAQLNFKLSIQDEMLDELRRAARCGEVRFVGTSHVHSKPQEISLGYWDAAIFDRNALWDSEYEPFTRARLASDYGEIMLFRFGRAPREDVIRTWPRASYWLQLQAKVRLCLRRARHALGLAWQD